MQPSPSLYAMFKNYLCTQSIVYEKYILSECHGQKFNLTLVVIYTAGLQYSLWKHV